MRRDDHAQAFGQVIQCSGARVDPDPRIKEQHWAATAQVQHLDARALHVHLHHMTGQFGPPLGGLGSWL